MQQGSKILLNSALLVFGVGMIATHPANAATITVDTFNDAIDPNDGVCSLREAIINANNNSAQTSNAGECIAGTGDDVITLVAGTYTLSITGRSEDAGLTGDLDITNNNLDTVGSLSINGVTDVNGAPASIIDANGIDRIFDIFNHEEKDNLDQGANFAGVAVTLNNLKLINGLANETIIDPHGVAVDNQANGGAVFSWRFNDLTIDNCVFDNNQAVWDTKVGIIDPDGTADSGDEIEERTLSGHGGAVYSRGEVTITDSTFSNNIAYTTFDLNGDSIIEGEDEKSGNGGGLFIAFTSTITDSSFLNNIASNGGGINTTGGEPAIVPGNMTISGSSFVDNWAVMGGGVNNVSPQVTLDIINSTFSSNESSDMGAGINSDAAVHLKQVTVVDNRVTNSDQNGAGINYFGPAGQFFLSNTLLSNNDGKSEELNCGCTGGSILACSTLQVTSLGGNLSSDFNCGLRTELGDLTGPDPKVLPLAANGGATLTHALDYDSLAIDAGRNTNCVSAIPAITTDQRGVARPQDGDSDGTSTCDIGAYERKVANTDLVLNSLTLSAVSVYVGDEVTIAVSAGNTGPDTASATRVDVMLPDELDFVSGEITGGAPCTLISNRVSCALGDLGASASENMNIVATANAAATVDITATVSALEVDAVDVNNNTATKSLLIESKDVVISSSGGGFCSYHPDGKLDLTLPALLLLAFSYLGWRRDKSHSK